MLLSKLISLYVELMTSFEEIYGPPENFLEIEVSRVAMFVVYTC